MKQKIQQAIGEALTSLKIEAGDFSVEYSDDFAHGDFTTNVAMAHAKAYPPAGGQNPRALAEKIVEKLKEQKNGKGGKTLSEIDKIEVAGLGFINFYLSRDFFAGQVKQILKDGNKIGKNHLYKGKKVMIEYTDPNPFKPFHIGHLMSNSIGETLSRLIENAGAEVKRAYYGGDVGLHVAKTIWAITHGNKNGATWEEIKKSSVTDQVRWLGNAYTNGSANYEENKIAQKEIQEINKKVFEKSDEKINKIYDWGRQVSIEHFHEIYKKLDTRFDFEFFESEMAPIGMFLVEEFLAKGIFEKSEGAIVFKGEKYGLHTRVFVTSQGLPTYETKELGLTKRKMELYPFDLSIVVTANEQNDYFKVLLKVIEFVFPSIASKMRHISHGMLRFTEGKMSSRKGNVITGESLIDEVEKMVDAKISERDLTTSEKKDIRQKVAIAAIKFSILKQTPGSDIIFDAEKSVSFEGDSGPYLQYSAVRAQSVLHKAATEKIAANISNVSDGVVSDDAISDFEKLLTRFPDIVERATVELAPQKIVTYLLELASAFNAYYANHKIVDVADQFSPYKVALTQSFAQIMTNGLLLIGISVPEKM